MDELIQMAIEQARKSDLTQKHGSILVCNDQVFAGYNHFAGHRSNFAIHAEEHVIRRYLEWCRTKYFSDNYIRRKLKKAVLITIRVKNDSIKCSAPCRDCIELIKRFEIKHIIYSDQDNEQNPHLVSKKIRDVQNRPSSGYRWRERRQHLLQGPAPS